MPEPYRKVFVKLSYENAVILHYLLTTNGVNDSLTAHEKQHVLSALSEIGNGIERYRALERRSRNAAHTHPTDNTRTNTD